MSMFLQGAPCSLATVCLPVLGPETGSEGDLPAWLQGGQGGGEGGGEGGGGGGLAGGREVLGDADVEGGQGGTGHLPLLQTQSSTAAVLHAATNSSTDYC